MRYDYLTINYAAVAGIVFLLIFLHANATLAARIKRIFYLLISIEWVEIITYSLELWTTTFEHLSPMRLWLSAIGYSVRPFILCLIVLLAARNARSVKYPQLLYLPAAVNVLTSFSVFFTDVVYSYTADNQFVRGPLGYFTHIVALLYLLLLIIVVITNYKGRSKLETMIIFAISFLIVFYMLVEALYGIRTLGRTSIVLITIFYYMFFQSQVYKDSLSEEKIIRSELELANRTEELTGLLTKKAFAEASENLLRAYSAIPHSGVAFIFVDLDHLKAVNDTFGHSQGDIAIVDAANSLREIFRKNDLISRFGGDEYCILLLNIPEMPLENCLKKINEALRHDYVIGDRKITVSSSVGAVHVKNTAGLHYADLMHKADEALYEAKAAGRDCYRIKNI